MRALLWLERAEFCESMEIPTELSALQHPASATFFPFPRRRLTPDPPPPHPGRCRRQGREGGLEVTIREQQGRRMKHENGESEPCVYAMSVRHARKMCQKKARATRSACPPVAHTVATTWVRNPETKILRFRRSTSTLMSPTRTLSANLLSTDHRQ